MTLGGAGAHGGEGNLSVMGGGAGGRVVGHGGAGAPPGGTSGQSAKAGNAGVATAGTNSGGTGGDGTAATGGWTSATGGAATGGTAGGSAGAAGEAGAAGAGSDGISCRFVIAESGFEQGTLSVYPLDDWEAPVARASLQDSEAVAAWAGDAAVLHVVVAEAGLGAGGAGAAGDRLHAVARCEDCQADAVRLSWLTDSAYWRARYLLAAPYSSDRVDSQLGSVARRLIQTDLDGDDEITGSDLLWWDASVTPGVLVPTSSDYAAWQTQHRDAPLVAALEATDAALRSLATPVEPTDLVVREGVAFATLGPLGLQTYSATLVPDGAPPLTLAGTSQALALSGDRALVAAGDGGLHVVDISDPHAPAFLRTIDFPDPVLDVALGADGTCFVLHPSSIRSVDWAGSQQSVEVWSTSGSLIALEWGNGRLVAVGDAVSVLAPPPEGQTAWVLLGEATPGGSMVHLDGDRALVARHANPYPQPGPSYSYLTVYDVSDAAPAEQIAQYSFGGGTPVYGVRVIGDVLYLSTGAGVLEMDTSLGEPEPVVVVPGASGVFDVTGDRALVGSASGLALVALDHLDDHRIGQVDLGYRPDRPAWIDDTTLLVGSSRGVHAIYVGNPAAPVLLDSYVSSYVPFNTTVWLPARATAASGDFAAIYEVGCTQCPESWRYYHVRTLDVSVPGRLRAINDVEATPGDLAVIPGYAVMTTAHGLSLVHMAEGVAPVEVGTLGEVGFSQLEVTDDGFAVLADQTLLSIVDLSDPAAPGLRGTLALTGGPLFLEGARAFVADGTELLVIDIANPDAPEFVKTLDLPGPLAGVHGRYAYTQEGVVIDLEAPRGQEQAAHLGTPRSRLAGQGDLLCATGHTVDFIRAAGPFPP